MQQVSRRHLALGLTLFGLSGCGSDRDRVAGRWHRPLRGGATELLDIILDGYVDVYRFHSDDSTPDERWTWARAENGQYIITTEYDGVLVARIEGDRGREVLQLLQGADQINFYRVSGPCAVSVAVPAYAGCEFSPSSR